MISLLISDDLKFEQDIRELVSAFFPGESFIHEKDEASLLCVEADREHIGLRGSLGDSDRELKLCGDRKRDKSILKKELYLMLSGMTGKQLPWGTLTGIRPVKLYENEYRAHGREAAEKQLKEDYLISDEKLRLLSRTFDMEREALSHIDYKQGFSLYIGIPFCPSTCLYCSFTSNPISRFEGRIDEYIEALRNELRGIRAQQLGAYEGKSVEASADRSTGSGQPDYHLYGRELQTIYIGGGTPTSLSALQLEKLLSMVEKEMDLQGLREYTVEAGRPDSIDRDKLRVLKAHGIDRISINPQTMNDRTLELIGRRHTAADVERAYALAREEGFDNINMDLIMGLPEEGLKDVDHTLSCMRRFGPESLTVHALAVKRAARLTMEGLAYAGLKRAGMEEASEMIRMGAMCAEELGMGPYYLYRQKNMAGNQENVGYCIPGRANLYNILMMEEKHTVVGIGAGSSTKVVIKNADPSLFSGNESRVERHENVKNIEIYLNSSKRPDGDLS